MADDTHTIRVPTDVEVTTFVDYFADPRFRDSVVMTDVFNAGLISERLFDDWTFMVDEALFEVVFTRAFADAVAMSDAFTRTATFNLSFADSVIASDGTSATLGSTTNTGLSDNVTMLDAFSPAMTMPRTLADSVVMSDAFSQSRIIALDLADNVVMGDGTSFDPYWDKVQLLLHGDGPYGGQNYTFLDSSPQARTVGIQTGFPFQGQVSPYVNVGGSAYFGATSTDALASAQHGGDAFQAGIDFTIEAWVFLTANSPPDSGGFANATILGSYQADALLGWSLNIQGSATTTDVQAYFEIHGAGSTYDAIGDGTSVPLKKWTHIAVCRQGTVTRIFRDGVLKNSITFGNQNIPNGGPMVIGKHGVTGIGRYLKGYISDVRVSRGAAYYTANFTPPVAPLDMSPGATALGLKFTNASVVDSARKNVIHMDGAFPDNAVVKWGPTALSIDGSNRSSNIATPYQLPDRFVPMGEDFTIELWFWLYDKSMPDAGGYRHAALISNWPNGGPVVGFTLEVGGSASATDGGLFIEINDGVTPMSLAGATIVTHQVWHHAAFSRIGNVGYLHLDGVLQDSKPMSVPVIPPAPAPYNNWFLVGMTGYPGYPRGFWGLVDDVRYTLGKGRYGAANFTPPGAPFPDGIGRYSEVYSKLITGDAVAVSDVFSVPVTPIVFRGQGSSATAAVARPAGIQVGDVVVVEVGSAVAGVTLATVGGSAWNKSEIAWSAYGYWSQLFWKILNATDVANAWNLSTANPHTAAAYAAPGAATVTLKATYNMPAPGVGIVTLPGFAPAARSMGIISAVSDRGGSAIFVPAGFTERAATTHATYWAIKMADRASGYAGGNIVWDVDDSYAAVGWALEVA